MLGCSRMEDLVFAGNFKTFDALKAVVGSKFVVEMYFDCIVHYLHLLESHSVSYDVLHAIGLVERHESQTLTHLLLLARMNLLLLVWIDTVVGADDTAVRDYFCRIKLLLTQFGSPVSIHIIIMVRSNFYEIERHIALLEIPAPLSYEVGKALGILSCRITYVGTALIEEDSLDGIVEDRVEGAVSPNEWTMIIP